MTIGFASSYSKSNTTTTSLLESYHPATLQLMREGCSYKYLQMSITRYSFTELSELEQYGVTQLAKVSYCTP